MGDTTERAIWIWNLPRQTDRLFSNGFSTTPNTHTEFAHIGKRLEHIRTTLSTLNQAEWALMNGFSAIQWINWEEGVHCISLDAAIWLCDTYDLTLDFIYRGRQKAISTELHNAL